MNLNTTNNKYDIIELNEQYYDEFNKLMIEFIGTNYNIKNNINIENRYIYLIKKNNKIIGTGTLFIINKVHCKNVGLIEDVFISNIYRGNGYGKIIIEYLISKAKNFNCYKLILNCKEKNIEFYKKNNFNISGFEMNIRFENR